ncbi:hypothetical protein FKM82_020416 [Ascaphus truei]
MKMRMAFIVAARQGLVLYVFIVFIVLYVFKMGKCTIIHMWILILHITILYVLRVVYLCVVIFLGCTELVLQACGEHPRATAGL